MARISKDVESACFGLYIGVLTARPLGTMNVSIVEIFSIWTKEVDQHELKVLGETGVEKNHEQLENVNSSSLDIMADILVWMCSDFP